ncbi:hypothetical protein JCM10213_005568 [Rhodosporidiobolus nylandii]
MPPSEESFTFQACTAVLPVLRLVQNTSGITFSVFTVLHLASPLSALLPSKPKYISSAENRSSGIQLLAREVYQGEWSEPVLVWGSLSAHVLSGIAVRWLGVIQRLERRAARREKVKRRARKAATVDAGDVLARGGAEPYPLGPGLGLSQASEAEKDLAIDELEEEEEAELVATTTADEELVVPSVAGPTPAVFQVPNGHQAAGYALVPFLLHHAYVHRLLPASPFPPISSLSPSFFSYSFPALALNHQDIVLRIGSAISYAAVTGLATYHGLVGWRILLDPTAPRSLKPRRRRAGEKDGLRRKVTGGREWQATWVALVAGVSVGTARIAGYLGGERTVKVPRFVAERMDYVLRKGFGKA